MIAAEKAESLRKQQQALAALPVGGLYIAMFLNFVGDSIGFHWGFYLNTGGSNGMKYHVTGSNAAGWRTDHAEVRNSFKSVALTVFVKVGQIPADSFNQLDQIMRLHDANLLAIPGVNCHVWLFEIMKQLVQKGLVKCSGSMGDLEAECREFGDQYKDGALKNVQPKPVVVSAICS